MQKPCLDDRVSASMAEITGYSGLEAAQLVCALSSAITDCGGCLLEHGCGADGALTMTVEFGCRRALDFYSALVASDVEPTRNGHLILTRLCLCALHHKCGACAQTARVSLRVHRRAAYEQERGMPGSPAR